MQYYESVTRYFQVVHNLHVLLAEAPKIYSQSRNDADGWRDDCSGQICKALRLPKPGYSTVTLITQHIMFPIPWDQAVPGDFWGHMGDNTGGSAGHVGGIVGTPATDGAWVIIDHGFSDGPRKRRFGIPPSNYSAYRLVGIELGANMELGQRILGYGASGKDVGQAQGKLMEKGFSVGASGADNDFGKNTRDGVIAFQSANALPPTGVIDGETYRLLVGPAKLSQAVKDEMTTALDKVRSRIVGL